MSNVQPGDLARIIPPATAAGAFVSVIRAATKQEYDLVASRNGLQPGEAVWAVRLMTGAPSLQYQPLASLVNGEPTFSKNYGLPGTPGLCEDSRLRRIDPESDPAAEPRVTETPRTEHA